MTLSWELLLEFIQNGSELTHTFPKVHLQTKRNNDVFTFTQFQLLPCEERGLAHDTLWFSDLKKIRSFPAGSRSGLCVVCVGEEEDFQALCALDDCCCIYLPDCPDGAAVFNLISGFWQRVRQWEMDLDVAVARRAPIQEIVVLAESMIKNPIVAWDPSFKIVAKPTRPMIEHPHVQETIDRGYFSGSQLKQFIGYGLLKNSNELTRFRLFYPPSWSTVPYALRTYTKAGLPCFTVACYFTLSTPTAGQMELLDIFDRKLGSYALAIGNQETSGYSQAYIYEPLLKDLISNQLNTESELRERLEYIRWDYEQPCRLCEVRFKHFTYSLAGYTRALCKRVFSGCKTTIYRKSVYILWPVPDGDEGLSDTMRAQLSDLLETVDGFFSSSLMVPTLLHIHEAAAQTEAALRIGGQLDPGRRLWSYRDIYFQDMVLSYVEHGGTGGGGQLVFPTLKNVLESDQRSGNNNLELLEFYLNSDRSITKTSKHMNLHRNSVIYRLQRIEQMLEASLGDPDIRFDLLLSLRVLAALKLNEAEQELPVPESGKARYQSAD